MKIITVTVLSIYIFVYSVGTMWVLFDGFINDFSSLNWLWGSEKQFSILVSLILFTIFGSILGGAVLSITSFHKYFAVQKIFDSAHIWGFLFTPILSSIVGLTVFSLVNSSLLILGGSFNREDTVTSALGFTAIGCISGYNWDVVIWKLQQLSKSVFNTTTSVQGSDSSSST